MEGTVTVDINRQGHVMLIGLDRPNKYNAFDVKMFHDLAAAFGEFEASPQMRCAVLYANGEHFTTGLDFPQWTPKFEAGEFGAIPEGGLDPLSLHGEGVTKPIVCAVHGWCVSLGIELLLATDIRVAASNTRFAQMEVRRGIYPVGGATTRLHREIGWGNAMRYLLTGDEFSAEEAHRMGLVQEVVEPGAHVDRALEIAETVAAQAPLGVTATLKSARLDIEQGPRAATDRLLPDLQPLLKSEDAQEGMESFLERRDAVFKGR